MTEPTCRLCSAVPSVDLGDFYLIFCDQCEGKPPILVLKEHQRYLTPHQQNTFDMLRERYFPGFKPRGMGMRTEPRHWHEHLIPADQD